MLNSLAHIEINVSNINTSKEFYNKILNKLGWKNINLNDKNTAGFKALDNTHIFLVQINDNFKGKKFHRKNIGLNHISFRVKTKDDVIKISKYLDEENIKKLYHEDVYDYSKEYGTERYDAIFFEDPDGIKLEVVFVE